MSKRCRYRSFLLLRGHSYRHFDSEFGREWWSSSAHSHCTPRPDSDCRFLVWVNMCERCASPSASSCFGASPCSVSWISGDLPRGFGSGEAETTTSSSTRGTVWGLAQVRICKWNSKSVFAFLSVTILVLRKLSCNAFCGSLLQSKPTERNKWKRTIRHELEPARSFVRARSFNLAISENAVLWESKKFNLSGVV